MDGFFTVAPTHFIKLYTIDGDSIDKNVVGASCVPPEKLKKAYMEMLNKIVVQLMSIK